MQTNITCCCYSIVKVTFIISENFVLILICSYCYCYCSCYCLIIPFFGLDCSSLSCCLSCRRCCRRPYSTSCSCHHPSHHHTSCYCCCCTTSCFPCYSTTCHHCWRLLLVAYGHCCSCQSHLKILNNFKATYSFFAFGSH